MNRKIIIVLLISLLSVYWECSNNRSGSNNTFEIEKFKSICKVWGLLKYYHPGVGSGKLDWDNILIETLRKSDTTYNQKHLNQLIGELIDSCNNYEEITIDSSFLTGVRKTEHRFSWLNDTTLISYQNTIKLRNLVKNKLAYINYHVTQNNDVGNLLFDNEIPYSDSVFPSRNLRLLALFRYWNIINYFYPYHELNDQSWDSCLSKYIPKFDTLSDTIAYHLKILELTSELNDGHIWTESSVIILHFGIYSPPYKLRYIEKKPIICEFFPDSLGRLYNIKIGDQVLGIDDKPIEEIIADKFNYYSFSNQDHYYRRIMEELLITPSKDTIKLNIYRKGKILDVFVKPYLLYEMYQIQERENNKKIAYRIINDSIGYINLKYLDLTEVDTMMSSFIHLNKIIIDIRNYPNGVLYEISKYLNPSPSDFVKIFIPDIAKPGDFIWDTTLQTGIYNDNYFKGKVILIVNEQTQSHAEFTAMCLQSAPNILTIGSTTAGTDGNVSYVHLPGNIITYFTSIGIVYPDGTQTQRNGIIIDSLIRPQIDDFRNNYDRLLNYAIQL